MATSPRGVAVGLNAPAQAQLWGRSSGLCRLSTLPPVLQIGEFTAAARALECLGVAHGARLIACNHPVVAAGAAVAAAVDSGGWIRGHVSERACRGVLSVGSTMVAIWWPLGSPKGITATALHRTALLPTLPSWRQPLPCGCVDLMSLHHIMSQTQEEDGWRFEP